MPFDEQKKDDHEDGDDHEHIIKIVNEYYIAFAVALKEAEQCQYCGHMKLLQLALANMLKNEFDSVSALRFLAKDGTQMLAECYMMAFDPNNTELRP